MKLWLVVGLYDREHIELHSAHPTRIGAEIARRKLLLSGFRERYDGDVAREMLGGLPPDLLDELVDVVENGGAPNAHVTDILEQVGGDASYSYQLSVDSIEITAELLTEMLAVDKSRRHAKGTPR